MKLGILSDTHNEISRTRAALAAFRAWGADKLVHCGDVNRPAVVQLFQGWDTVFVYGNLDRDKGELDRAVAQVPGPLYIDITYEAILAGVRVGVCHGHDLDLLDAMIGSGAYDLVLHGHTHAHRDEQIDTTRVINPGALGGRYVEPRSVCIVDLVTLAAEFVYVG